MSGPRGGVGVKGGGSGVAGGVGRLSSTYILRGWLGRGRGEGICLDDGWIVALAVSGG